MGAMREDEVEHGTLARFRRTPPPDMVERPSFSEADIQRFWTDHPCGEHLVDSGRDGLDRFFTDYDRFRYRLEPHIPDCLDEIGFAGRRTLEIGLGQGADSEAIIRRGAIWSGVDLTAESVRRVGQRLALRGLPHAGLRQGSVLDLPFPDGSMDIVYSHGVLHHVPDIVAAQREIRRVLTPDGLLVVMLYARWSLNYLLSIALLRRLGLLALAAVGARPGGLYGRHLDLAREQGIGRYLRLENFVHRNTDGPDNPYSKVYDLAAVRRDFPDFTVLRSFKRFMHAPPLPVHGLPGESLLGWHLWVHMRPNPARR